MTGFAALVAAILASAFYFLYEAPLWDRIPKGLDLQGGVHVVYRASPLPDSPVNDATMTKTLQIMEQRVNALGVAEPVLQRQGADRIIVELPGVKNPEEAIRAIGRTARLEFKDEAGKVIVTGADLATADAQILDNGQVVVALRFKGDGVRRFAEATRAAAPTHRRIGIYLDGQLLQNPTVQDPIENGQAVITGYTSYDEARAIAVSLQSGALPVALEIIENRTVSASLGSDSLGRSQVAAVVGVVAVAAFMLAVYRLAGLLAVLALTLYLVLFLGVLWAIGATLTLPGIAGAVLSVGMAVDANVIIFERIREELRLGKSIRSALEAGHANAFRAIFDGNVTTLIAAAILLWLGSGPVRGFAVTLGVGVLTSMFTAIVVTRYLLVLLVGAGMRPNWSFFGAGRAAS
ncbi:MAG: protein translocase subunit SecD [Clostridia bacterium]|nr:protein translocase subunit SecD [Clostridia bacterium]